MVTNMVKLEGYTHKATSVSLDIGVIENKFP
jgi:hypothetical protein